MPKLEITDADASASASKKAPAEPAAAAPRFVRVGRLLIDLAAVVAIEPGDSNQVGAGPVVLHLSGGQAVELPPDEAAGVLRRLGVTKVQGKKKPRAPRVKRRARVTPAAVAKGLLPAIAGLFSKAS